MAELYASRKVLHAVPGSEPGKFDRVSRLREDTTPQEVPDGIYRGDVVPLNPRPWARWYRATGSAGAGNGEWYHFDPARNCWLSDRILVAEFFQDNLDGETILASGDGGYPLKMPNGIPVAAAWGYPLIARAMLVQMDFNHDLTAGASFNFAIAINGVLTAGPPLSGGFISCGAAPQRNQALAKSTLYDPADGGHITGHLLVNAGTSLIGSGDNFFGRGFFRYHHPAA